MSTVYTHFVRTLYPVLRQLDLIRKTKKKNSIFGTWHVPHIWQLHAFEKLKHAARALLVKVTKKKLINAVRLLSW
jgi:hypothetical protein